MTERTTLISKTALILFLGLCCSFSSYPLSFRENLSMTDSAAQLFDQRQYDASLRLYERVLASEKYRCDVSFCGKHGERVGLLYFWKQDFERAAYYYKMALKYQLSITGEMEALSRIMIGLGYVYSVQGKSNDALLLMQKADEILTITHRNDVLLADVKVRIGRIYHNYGDYQKALRYFLLGQQIATVNIDTPDMFYVLLYASLSSSYFASSEFNLATACYKRLLLKNLFLVRDREVYISQLSMCYFRLGQIDSAKYYFNTIDWSSNREISQEALLNYAVFLSRSGEISLALPYYQRAIQSCIRVYGTQHPSTSRFYYHLGDHWNRAGEPDSAIKYLNAALESLGCEVQNRGSENSWVGATSYVRHLVPVLEKRGTAFYLKASRDTIQREYWLLRSVAMYQLAVHLIMKTYSDYQADDSRIYLSQAESPLFAQGIKICMALDSCTGNTVWMERAFKLSEQSKAGALMTTFRKRDAFDLAKVSFVFKDADQRLNAAVYQTEQQLSQVKIGDSLQLLVLRKKLVGLYQMKEQLARAVVVNYPAFVRLGWTSMFPEMRQIQSVIDDQTVFVEYACDSNALFIFTVTSTECRVAKVSIDRQFFDQVEEYKRTLNQPPLLVDKKMLASFANTAHGLWTKLVKPCLSSVIGKRRMIVVPDAALSGVSFDALIDHIPDTSIMVGVDFSVPSYLIKQLSISYGYSAAWFLSTADAPKGAGREMILFAPDYTTVDDTLEGEPNFSSIEFAQKEVGDIIETWDATLYRGKEATRTKFMEVAPEARVLHVAMHSMADTEQPLQSCLIFSSHDTSGRRLGAADLYSMCIPADLVVLSSCNSGGGKALPGEGMMSLARAFIYSGSKSVVMTMWPVKDVSGASVMSMFYEYLSAGAPTDIALQQAKLKFLRQSGSIEVHPAYWANYALVGQRKVIQTDKSYKSWVWPVGAFGALMLAVLAVFIKYRSNIRKKKTAA